MGGAPIVCSNAPPTRTPSRQTAHRLDWATPNARALVAGRRACTKAASSALLVPVSVPYAGAVPNGGLIRLRRPRSSGPPSSSGLGHRPFKAAARVRIPLGARAGDGCQHEVL